MYVDELAAKEALLPRKKDKGDSGKASMAKTGLVSNSLNYLSFLRAEEEEEDRSRSCVGYYRRKKRGSL